MRKEINISNNKAVINFSKAYFNNSDDLLKSEGFFEVICSFVNHHKENRTRIYLSLIHISEPTRPCGTSRMPSSA